MITMLAPHYRYCNKDISATWLFMFYFSWSIQLKFAPYPIMRVFYNWTHLILICIIIRANNIADILIYATINLQSKKIIQGKGKPDMYKSDCHSEGIFGESCD